MCLPYVNNYQGPAFWTEILFGLEVNSIEVQSVLLRKDGLTRGSSPRLMIRGLFPDLLRAGLDFPSSTDAARAGS